MKESWICRDYRSGDEYEILTLFKEVFGTEMSLAFWNWRFIENPFGKGIIKLLFDNDKLIGHYAVVPMNVQLQGELLKAVFSMTTMTHPEYSGQGIFTYLSEATYKLCQQRGFHFVYGFPNKNSYYGFTHKLKWNDLGKITTLEKKIQSKAQKNPARIVVKKIEHFEGAVNPLWDKVKQGYTIIIPRTEEFLNWRFVENPEVNYEKHIALDGNDCVLGYVVLKVYIEEDAARGHIVDMISIADEGVVKLLLEYSYEFFLEKGIRDISCWIPEDSFYSEILRRQGFAKKQTETYFGVRIFSKEDTLCTSAKEFANWFLTMGDSDVF